MRRLAALQSPVFLVNSRLGLVSAAPPSGGSAPSPEVTGLFCRVPWPRLPRPPRHALPAHLRRSAVRARAGYSARAFLGPLRAPVRTGCFPGLSAGRGRPEPRRPLGGRRARASGARCRNVYLPPFGCAWRPPLRTRLTLGGRAFPRKPRAFGGGGSHPTLATRAGILTPARSTGARRTRFAARGKLPYRWRSSLPSRRFGASLSPVNCRRPGARPVSCYALLGRVAASEPTSWLSARPDILCHSARTWGPWRAVWAVPLSGARLSPRVLTPALHAACVRSSVPFGRLRGPLGDPVALPPAGSARGPP